MAFIRKTDISRLTEVLTYRTVDSRQTAEDIAAAVLQLSYNRNLLLGQVTLRRYVAAVVYLLAHRYPVPVSAYTGGCPVPVRYRSRMGDIPHLFVLLSYSPATVLSYLHGDARVAELFSDLLADTDLPVLEPLSANMSRIILEDGLLSFRSDAFTLRVPAWAVTPMAKAVAWSSYDLGGLSAKGLLVRCSCDIRASLETERTDDELTLPVLGARFRSLRGVLQLTQRQFAQRLGISKSACLRLEAGQQISADVLFRCLAYWSRSVNLDVFFDRRIWELAQVDRDLLYKKVHIMSVIHRKHQLLHESLRARLRSVIDELPQGDGTQRARELLALAQDELDAGFFSILSLTDK